MFLPDQPLQFDPIFRSYIWGGQRLAARLGKKTPENEVWAESWEIVDHREGESLVSSGPFRGWSLRKLIQTFPVEITGHNAPEERFPLLLKYLDCQRVLSVQVHPDDVYGSQMTVPDRGKTEAWYVIESEPNALLYAGLKPDVTPARLRAAIEQGTTEECLHVLHPRAGDCVFIPAGTVHALGAGLLVAEIQQASDCTFRLFDWNRVDKDGKPRPLHIKQAMEVIAFDRGPVDFVRPVEDASLPGWRLLVDCDKFVLREARGESPIVLPSHEVCILTIPSGVATLHSKGTTLALKRGESVLLPSACEGGTLELHSDSVALLATLPNR
jgi:mannose-6-phosphate isomerase